MIQLPKLQECTTVFVAGPVSSGKTFLLKRLVDKMERSLTLDISADFSGPDYEHFWSNPVALGERLKTNPYYYRLAYHASAENYPDDFHWCYASIWMMRQPRWFVIDEVQEVCSVHSMHPGMSNILRYSRKNLLGVIGASQRIADVNRLLTHSARMVILFQTIEPTDLDAINQRFGPDVANAVQNLRPCIYNDSTQTTEQEPECLVYMKGHGYQVLSLGSKIKPDKGEEGDQIEWQEDTSDRQTKLNHASSQPDTGAREPRSSDGLSDSTK